MKIKIRKRAGIWTEGTKCKNHTVDLNCILVNASILNSFQDKVECEQIVSINIKRSSRIKSINEIKLNYVSIFLTLTEHLLSNYILLVYYEETNPENTWFLKKAMEK